MPTLSNRVAGLQESAIRKLDLVVAKQHGVRFYRLNIGQPDIPTPEPMLQAIRNYDPKVISYGPASGTPECRQIAAEYTSRWSPGMTAQHVAVTTGGSEALLFAFTAVCDPGDEILVPEPYYTNYNGFATLAGATVTPIPTRIEDAFALPSDAELDARVSERTKALVINSPGNPTGVVYSREEMKRIVDWAIRRDIFLISDEVYRRIWFEREPTSALEFEHAREHVICIDSMSKAWSACGIRIGFLFSRNEALMEKVERLGQARLGPQPLGQAVAIAALQLPESYYEELRNTWKSRVDTLYDSLSELGIVSMPRPQGAFYMMAALPVENTEDFARFLVTDFRDQNESIVVAPGPGFHADPSRGRNQIRLAAVLEEAQLKRAVEILGKALEAYPTR